MDVFLNLPEALVTTPVSWLLTYLVHSTLLILMVRILVALPMFRAYHIQDLLWKGALVAGIFTCTFQCSGGLERLDLSLTSTITSAESILEPEDTHLVPEASNEVSWPVLIQSRGPYKHVLPTAQGRVVDAEAGTWPIWTLQSLLGIWAMGVLMASSHYLIRRRRFFNDIGVRRPLHEGFLVSTLTTLCDRCGYPKKVHLSTSAFLKSPVALSGHEICIPERALTELQPVQQEAMLAHELAHIIRRDPIWLMVWAMIEILFFFQPLNRLARRYQQAAAEPLCDAWAVSQTGRHHELASCLLQVAVWLKGERPLTAVSAMASSPLSLRIQHLLTGSTMKTTSLHRGHLILMSGLMLLVTFLAPQVTLKAAQPAPPDPPEPVSVQVEPVLPQVDAPPAPEILAPVLPDTVLEASVPVEPQAPQQPFPLEAVVPDLPEPILPQPPRRPIPGQAANPRYQWEKDGVRYVVETEGDITLSDDHRTIQRISSDGHFFGQTGIGQSRTTIDVTPGTGGLLAYEFRVRGELKPFDAAGHSRNEAKVWLADMLLSWQEIREEMADMEEEMGKLQLDMERRQIDRAQLQEHMVNMNQALSADMLQSQAELRRSMVDMQESMRHLELDKMQSLLEAERQLKKANDLAANQIRLDLAEKMALNEDKLRAAQDMMIQLERSHLDREGNTFKQVYDAMLRARDLIEHNRPNVDELKQIREALRNLEEAIQDLETDG